MKIKDARLCANCDEVYEVKAVQAVQSVYHVCPSCGSGAFMFLSKWVPTMGDERYNEWIEKLRSDIKKIKEKEVGYAGV